MNISRIFPILFLLVLNVAAAHGSIFGDIRGTVSDPLQGAVAGAKVTLHSNSSSFSHTVNTDTAGEFSFRSVPIGEYVVTVEANGFSRASLTVTVLSDRTTVVRMPLKIAPVSQQVQVKAENSISSDSATPVTLISRKIIAETPGADRANSLSMITNYVPGSYLTHNQLHIRGGHQVTWLVDGVPVANTNIADTVGPQFDPKDIDYLEVQRGSYSAEYGDRTYGIFNVVPRSGYERNREAELLLSYGNFNQTNDQISLGSHTKRFAYYASVSGNRSNYGLETPVLFVAHDASNGLGGFASLIFNPNAKDQFRLVTALRRDAYQVPNDADSQAAGVRDVEHERDAFINFSWLRTLNEKLTLTVSPFYHYNRAAFLGGPNDALLSARDERSSRYAGAQVALGVSSRRHDAKLGFYGFDQRDSAFFSLASADNSGRSVKLQQQNNPNGSLVVGFGEDQFKANSWLTLSAGLRLTNFHSQVNEHAISPRVGAALRLPRTNLVLHGFYGRFYQAPPLSTISGPLLEFALAQGFDFIPLRGERDEEYQVGVSIGFKGWYVDSDYFRTSAKNFFDHDALGNSNIFFPLTIDHVRVRAVELTARSPILLRCAQIHLAYSHQQIQGEGAVTGGLTDFSPPQPLFFLDHDQRDTLSAGATVNLPARSFLSANLAYGSGFLRGDGPEHLTNHTTFDLSVGKWFGENWMLGLQTVNLTNERFLLDSSNTFGGTHFSEPRQLYLELRHRFHY
ncbi:MAG TPA: TonB-dependent receptor [Pyrinomonadaceae bacterium]|jgi:outer membrane cobalamin receptor|nr:TonB-dependent receptor [Pyrinomonadaceae bacterium]